MNSLSACHDCDALYRIPELPHGGVIHCARCGAELHRSPGCQGAEISLAWTVTGLILFLIANGNPLLILKLGGRVQGNTLLAGVEALAGEKMWDLVVMVFGTTMLFPFLMLIGMLYVLLPLQFGRVPWRLALVFRLVNLVTPWAMMGVYLLGILVAYVKLISMATVVPGVAMYAFFGLIVAIAAARATLDARWIWRQIPVSS